MASIIITSITATLAFITFLINKVFFKRFKPQLYFNFEGKALKIAKKVKVNYVDEINKAAEQEDKEVPKYDISPIDPYKNPLGAMRQQSDQFKNRKMYMTNRNAYIKAYIRYLTDISILKQNNTQYEKLTLSIKNDGRLASGNIKIVLKGDFYEAHSEQVAVKKPERPVDFTSAPFGVALPRPLKSTDIQRERLSFIQHNDGSDYTLSCSHLSPKETLQLPNIYIDNYDSGEKIISYEITADKLSKPVKGKIQIIIG